MRLKVGLIALALAATGLAGCLQSATDTGTPAPNDAVAPVDPAATTLIHRSGGALVSAADIPPELLAQAMTLSVGHDAVEPTLGVASDGTLFYAAATFENGDLPAPKTNVLRSRDGGLTWEDVSPTTPTDHNNPPVTFDPYVWVDPDTDRVFSIDLEALACAVLSYSDDGGDTWITNPAGCGLPPGVHDHQTLVTGKPRILTPVGYPNLVYYCVNRIGDSACASSLNGGLTFGPLVTVFKGVEPDQLDPESGDGFCGGLHGHLAASPDGTLFLPKDHCGVPTVAVSKDDGLTWQTAVVNTSLGTIFGPDPNVAADEAGNAYYMWIAADGRAYVAVSTDGGLTWGPAVDVTAPGVTATHLPAIAAAGPGKIAFVYTGTTLDGGYEVEQNDDKWDEALWHGYLGVMTNATDPEGIIVTTLVNDPSDPLVRGRCGPGRCPGMYDFIDVVVDKTGRPWAAFVDACPVGCATAEDSNAFDGLVATLASGPSLAGTPPEAGNQTAGGLRLPALRRG